LDVSVISALTASELAVGVTIVGCVILAIIMFLSEDKRRPVLALFSRNVLIFTAPLLIVFAYLVVIWGAKILTR
jgi:hypothetical protein